MLEIPGSTKNNKQKCVALTHIAWNLEAKKILVALTDLKLFLTS